MIGGWAAAAPEAVGAATVNDLFADREKAVAMAVYVTGPLIGFVIAPVAGGFIAQTIGFKYVFIITSALCGLAALIGIPFLRETYAPVIRLRLARSSHLKMPQTFTPENQSIRRIMWLNLSRPVTLLTRSFICFILSLYLAM